MDPQDIAAIQRQFPALQQDVGGQPLCYLDNAATTQKPEHVINAIARYYREDNANVHRGVHTLAARATTAYEGARDEIARFIHAADRRGVVFTRGTTESINMFAQALIGPTLTPDDEILITALEHHANIVPWQLVCQRYGARLRVARVHDNGELDLDDFRAKLGPRTRVMACNESSNAIGTRNPIEQMIALTRQHSPARVLLDGAQAMAHRKIDVQTLDLDALAFSAHKMYGPTGFGVLYARPELLEQAEPWQGGGDMIETVRFEASTWADIPYKFEAGTPHIAGAIGTAAAIHFLDSLDLAAVQHHEQQLLEQATAELSEVDGLRIIGTAPDKAAIVSFVIDGAHPQDIATLLDEAGIAVRSGHHCAMPLMAEFGIDGTARASMTVYNSADDVDRLARTLHKISRLLRR